MKAGYIRRDVRYRSQVLLHVKIARKANTDAEQVVPTNGAHLTARRTRVPADGHQTPHGSFFCLTLRQGKPSPPPHWSQALGGCETRSLPATELFWVLATVWCTTGSIHLGTTEDFECRIVLSVCPHGHLPYTTLSLLSLIPYLLSSFPCHHHNPPPSPRLNIL